MAAMAAVAAMAAAPAEMFSSDDVSSGGRNAGALGTAAAANMVMAVGRGGSCGAAVGWRLGYRLCGKLQLVS